ncbi:hypothetical protein F8M41_022061 [Gigaspora margarita]|uniref:Uncharacterized protein n=1 Tax=Gigaspora margarita TaxID=4874 RepID=A0A8H4B1A2_GIGMA|nr:hypothetical protein F8M41_022061 [Gigaspora margarita]
MLQLKNNLQELLSTGYITEFSYNFTISLIKHQTVWYVEVIDPNRKLLNTYLNEHMLKKILLLLQKCNAFQRFKICYSCENKLYSPNDSDTQSQSLTISSEIDQLDQKSENNQSELEQKTK